MLSRKIALFFILCMLTSSLSLLVNSDSLYDGNANALNSLSSLSETDTDFRVVKVHPTQDLDDNRFQDGFELALKESNPSQSFEAIISFSEKITEYEYSSFEKLNIEIIKEYSVIYALHVKGRADSLLQLRNQKNLVFIEENAVGKALLFSSTEQFGARKAWQTSLGYGYTGDPSTAIAILDTGIDDSHPDSNFNLVYWQDFAGANYSFTGDEYSTPTDKAEHGTHCASIAASKGAIIDNGTFKIQDSGYLPTTDGNAWYGTWFYVDSAQIVTLNLAWSGGGTSYVGIHNGTHWVGDNYATGFPSTPGTYQVSLPGAGWYAPMWGNKVSAGNNFYSGEVIYDSGWTNPYSDGKGAFAGVAPGSSVVALKVLDDMGVGSSNVLLNAIQWLNDNGQSYGVTVASLSIGWPVVVSSIDSAITSLVRNKGIVCVVSAGNGGTSSGGIFSPASSPDCIAVGAVNKAAEIAYYSSVGSVTDTYMRPDVVAPGGSFASSGSSASSQPIYAADSSDGDDAYNYNNYVQYAPGTDYFANNFRGLQGTSMACPFVAGIAQLVIDAMRQEGTWEYSWELAKKVKQIICMGTFEVRNIEGSISSGGETYDGDGDGTPQNPTIDRTTKDYTEGWGCVSAEAAVEAVTKMFSTTETFSLSGRVNGTHVAIRQLALDRGTIYRVEGDYVIDNFVDADILNFDSESNEFGDPILIADCSLGIVANDSTIFSVPDDGTYYMVVRWVDGNYEGKCKVTLSTIISVIEPLVGSVRNSGTTIKLSVDRADITFLSYYWDYTASMPFVSPYEVTLPSGEGIHILNITAQDYLTNNAEASLDFITDDTKPSISLTGATNNSVVTAEQIIKLNILDDNLDSVWISWDGGAIILFDEPYEFTVPSEIGLHTLNVIAEDEADNTEIVIFVFEVKSTRRTGNTIIPVALTMITFIGLSIIGKRRK